MVAGIRRQIDNSSCQGIVNNYLMGFNSPYRLSKSYMKGYEMTYCDNCGEQDVEANMYAFQHLPFDINSANMNESGIICKLCFSVLNARKKRSMKQVNVQIDIEDMKIIRQALMNWDGWMGNGSADEKQMEVIDDFISLLSSYNS